MNMKRLTPYALMMIAVALIYIEFGVLKIVGRSPIKDLVVATIPFMSNTVLFGIFGAIELFLGVGLLFKPVRIYAAFGIMIHVVGTFLTIILASNRILSPDTILTLEGEFVFKNILLLAVAYFIIVKEKPASKFSKVKFTLK